MLVGQKRKRKVVGVLVRRLNTSWRTERRRAWVGEAFGSPTPKPFEFLGCKTQQRWKNGLHKPCRMALEDIRLAKELQNACKAFRI
jgi:hypothetical protein